MGCPDFVTCVASLAYLSQSSQILPTRRLSTGNKNLRYLGVCRMRFRILDDILSPLLRGLKKNGVLYRGVLYAGLMINEDGPKVLEFNARFGDPECQPVVMRLKSDLVPLLEATVERRLDRVEPEWYEESSVCVVLCSQGYPGSYEKGKEIRGLEKLQDWKQGAVFHAGTVKKDGRWLTSGGRVLGVTALGAGVKEATREVYRAVGEIEWEGMHYRKDIAHRALEGMKGEG